MGEATSKQGGARVRMPPPLVFVLAIGVGVALRYLLPPPPPLPGPRVGQFVVGALAIVTALALGFSAIRQFTATGQDPAPWKPSPELLLRGPYRFTRNPMYVSMMLVQAGVGLLLGNLWVLMLAPFALAVVHYTAVLPEEAYLDEKFGEPYRAFKKQVRRYL